MSVAVRRRDVVEPLGVAVAGLLVAAGLVSLRVSGHASFATDPLGALALVGAAVVAAAAGVRLSAAGARRAATWSRWLTLAVLIYPVTALWAVGSHAVGLPGAALAIAVWSSAWIPSLVFGQLTASAAIREVGRRRSWPHAVVLVSMGLAVVTNLVLVVPAAPFTGVPTIAPESWHTRLAPLGLAVTLLSGLALLLLPVRLWRAALTSEGAARSRFAVAAAGTSAAPLTIVFCLLLAAARSPGGVDPSLGSVAFLVALAASGALSAACAVLASRGAVAPSHLLIVVRGTGMTAAALLVIGLGTMAAAPGVGFGATATAVLIAAATVVVLGGAWFGTGALARSLLTVADPLAAVPTRLERLTPRENEVLALLAEGASNAGIAQQLVVSTRTVDAHLRSIFAKLDLGGPGDLTNRRVRAARIWLEAQE
ncbi:regulatory LuxR family protein [Brevibacterium sanguinis]|uniref:Regulatory LuxR family protein n=2 Tax=Brevibacterium TaxID=1696 RepID=A0A366II95_9MICO|nr:MULTISPECIES: LuxR C-terminal-related transcriptional regulator [Brevibacterium]RBP64136.1 regulatory LuxR family protein [Brevibacterium sanguinis]RBP71572.1 regulatory LuxR family protein [Brevibacterium celere]